MVHRAIPDISVVDLAIFGQHCEFNGVALVLVP
jgi:hypothetical protein